MQCSSYNGKKPRHPKLSCDPEHSLGSNDKSQHCQLNRSMQHFVEVYCREFEIPEFFTGGAFWSR